MTNEQRIENIKELGKGLDDSGLLALQTWVTSEQWRRTSCAQVPFSYDPPPIISGGFSKAILDIEHSFPK